LEGIGGRLLAPVGNENPELVFAGLSYDSRKVKEADAFFCIEGEKQDGNKFIADAVKAGAACIITERQPADSPPAPCIIVKDVRLALAQVGDYFFEHPSGRLRLLGVTGTNGKTTTTHLVEHILLHDRRRVGLIGTLGARTSQGTQESKYLDMKHTTPQASDLQALLAEMAQSNVSHVAMEVSSHALALKRVAACDFAVACLTNITQDHLDFHKTMENYWQSKRILFEQLGQSKQPNKTVVLNADDPLIAEFRQAAGADVRVWTYGWHSEADARVKSAIFDFAGTRLTAQTPHGELDLNLHLNGKFNVYNVLAALLICLAEGVDLQVCKQALENFLGVDGRFQSVKSGSQSAQPLCIVDYAHTPDGLENVLKSARAMLPSGGKLLVVFGCGGDRDATKRPQMGHIAQVLAHELFVTSDNPRSEDPAKIIADILKGIERAAGVTVEQDRATAIKMAVNAATDQDIVLIAGKGHETYQILGDRTIDFDDRIEVQKALANRWV